VPPGLLLGLHVNRNHSVTHLGVQRSLDTASDHMRRRCRHAAGHHQVEREERQSAGMTHAQVIRSMAPVALSVAGCLIRFTTAGVGALSIRPLTEA
jgi:hypothetical protein